MDCEGREGGKGDDPSPAKSLLGAGLPPRRWDGAPTAWDPKKKRPSYSQLGPPLFDQVLVPELRNELSSTILWRRRLRGAAWALEMTAQLFLGAGSVLIFVGGFLRSNPVLIAGGGLNVMGLVLLRASMYAERERKRCEKQFQQLQVTIGIRPMVAVDPEPDGALKGPFDSESDISLKSAFSVGSATTQMKGISGD